jgi:hypothetical protein
MTKKRKTTYYFPSKDADVVPRAWIAIVSVVIS